MSEIDLEKFAHDMGLRGRPQEAVTPEDTVIPSCGNVFRDIGLEPEAIAVDIIQKLGMEPDSDLIRAFATAIREAETRGAKEECEKIVRSIRRVAYANPISLNRLADEIEKRATPTNTPPETS